MHDTDQARDRERDRWTAAATGAAPEDIRPASADASFRRYFRVPVAGGTRIVMDAPPGREDCRPYVAVAALLAAAGVHAPRVLAQDAERGFLLLTDLGTRTYLDALRAPGGAAAAGDLYRDALSALLRMQSIDAASLPVYDRVLLLRELQLFPDWYVTRHCGHRLDAGERERLAALFERIVAVNLAEPRVFVHRDYHSRNLMVSDPNPGVLDFQDAVRGPISYDLVSLLKDAYVEWPEERTLDWAARWWQQAKRAGLPVRADFGEFYRDYEWMGAQRHLKVLGIFARLWHRDAKPGYLADLPRVAGQLRRTCRRYAGLAPLLPLLDRLDERLASSGPAPRLP